MNPTRSIPTLHDYLKHCYLLLAVLLIIAWGAAMFRPLTATDLIQQQTTGHRVDLNSASAAELSLLPGIGPGLAQRIITHREKHGPFEHIDTIQNVPGIGPTIERRIRPYVVVQ